MNVKWVYIYGFFYDKELLNWVIFYNLVKGFGIRMEEVV